MKTLPLVLLALAACGALTSGCAQDVQDIDRTQPNRMLKSDLTRSDWFMAQTVVDVPTTTWMTFVGETSTMERVRWELREDMIVAYRVYPRLEGSAPSKQELGDEYTENPVAAYPVLGHFDIQRDYSTSTGEQTNVLVENYSDRPWFERDYVRVDWSRNIVVNFEMLATPAVYGGVSYFVPEEQGGADAMVVDRDAQDQLQYFDLVGKLFVEPDFWGCLYTYWGWAAEDCTASEFKVRTAFMRAEREREYEPMHYDDRLMSKFGYFRTERFGFDPWRGVRQSNRVQYANRHAMWEEVWKRGEDGEIVRDDKDRPIALPFSARTPKPIIYYASPGMPEEILETSRVVSESWNGAFRSAAAEATGKSLDKIPAMFVLCENPVAQTDEAVCGEPGTAIRMGDIRYNHMVWVDRYTQAGLLGYGPSGADPLSGEIIFGAAYVYGTEVDSYAQYAADLVRLLQGELTDEDIKGADYIREEILARLSDDPARPRAKPSSELRGIKPPEDIRKLLPRRKAEKLTRLKASGLPSSDRARHESRMQRLQSSGLDAMLVDDEIARGLTRGQSSAKGLAGSKWQDHVAPSRWASSWKMDAQKAWQMEAAKKNVYLSAFADDAIIGLARSLENEDPEVVRSQMRKSIYRAVMEHEVGHTIGLRHNFQGSYDALNYHDEYWELRAENLQREPDLAQMYEMAATTQKQDDGRMQEFAYSSIMDYGMRFNSDIQGIGKYDHAAVLFGYTSGTHEEEVGPEPGLVHVWKRAGDAAAMLRPYEDPTSLAYDLLLEQYHYTTVAQAFPELKALQERETVRYTQLLKQRDTDAASAPLEVHYMFCSDEWVGALLSCQVFDAGADPFEIARHTIRMYQDYYTLNHWSRDRAFFWSEDVLYSMYARYFSQLTHVYQQWVFAYFYGTQDATQDNYYLMAATSGFNQLADVLMTPAIGGYTRDARDNIYRLTSYDAQDADNELSIAQGAGRDVYTEYQLDSGYYYFDRVNFVGHFWDYLGALFALTDSEATRLGVDTSANEIAFSIPWYMFFEGELTQMMAGMFDKSPGVFGPRLKGDGSISRRPVSLLYGEDSRGREIAFNPLTGERVAALPTGVPIEIDTNFTQDFYALLYGMAFFTSNFSLSFPDQWRIFQLGSGEELQAGEGYERVVFEHPYNGVSYGALKPVSADVSLPGGAMLLERANTWSRRMREAPEEDLDAYYEAEYYMLDAVDRINVARSMYEVLGTTF